MEWNDEWNESNLVTKLSDKTKWQNIGSEEVSCQDILNTAIRLMMCVTVSYTNGDEKHLTTFWIYLVSFYTSNV